MSQAAFKLPRTVTCVCMCEHEVCMQNADEPGVAPYETSIRFEDKDLAHITSIISIC